MVPGWMASLHQRFSQWNWMEDEQYLLGGSSSDDDDDEEVE